MKTKSQNTITNIDNQYGALCKGLTCLDLPKRLTKVKGCQKVLQFKV